MWQRWLGRELADRLRRTPAIDHVVAEAMIATARRRFVDCEPMWVAQLLTRAQLRRSDRVLELGTTSGYLAAVSSRLAGEVVTVEPLRSFAIAARRRLADRANVIVVDDLARVDGTFDVIIVRSGDDEAPPALVERLRPGGRLLGAIGRGVLRVTKLGTAIVTLRFRSSPS